MNPTRKKSDKFIFYEALAKRLPHNHYFTPTVQSILRKESGGYAGEIRVDRELSEGQYYQSYCVLRNILVGSKEFYCQIDTLVIYKNFILIIEVKNIPGLLTYDEKTHQLTRRRDDGPIEGMGNPEDQLKRSERMVRQFLDFHKISLPVHGIIVFSNPSSILEKPFPNCLAIHVSGLYQTLEKLHRTYREHPTSPHFDVNELHKLFLQNEPKLPPNKPSHIPTSIFSDLIVGVLCPNCDKSKLKYIHKLWRCSICKYKSETTHLTTLQEYRILFSEEITTTEWMNFTNLKSLATTKRMLSECNLERIGGNRNRKWRIHSVHL
ncbi:NERD domain-containing protein [Paenisporosarcina quisquiliarum]|uniref:NERD domain-containing protein n=1 Tax=Paenisporosarcina quisquiliarum TaxID=365346 RepID=A0A9X3LH71_9BACL|nr:nuclease-related domain-containing protein [Paenisporosarcina quisquiliarum]MCZ8537627.1 NERD domain-containing protein [Paenisporosarcina quisquiliarum]